MALHNYPLFNKWCRVYVTIYQDRLGNLAKAGVTPKGDFLFKTTCDWHVVGMQCVIYNEVHPCVAGTTVFVSLSFEHLYRFSAIVLSIFVTCK